MFSKPKNTSELGEMLKQLSQKSDAEVTAFANESDVTTLHKLVKFIKDTAIPSYQPVFKKFEKGYIEYLDRSASREEASKALLKIAKDGGIKLYSRDFAGELTIDMSHPAFVRLDVAPQEVKDAILVLANKYAEAHTYLEKYSHVLQIIEPIANNRHAPEPEHKGCCVTM